jgi:hypothetical protein
MRAQRAAEIGHRVRIVDAASIQPARDLLGAIGLKAVSREALAERLDGVVLEVGAMARHPA